MCVLNVLAQELKILRIANALLNVFVCVPSMRAEPRDWQFNLHAMRKILEIVGGSESHFLAVIQQRMTELELPVSVQPSPACSFLHCGELDLSDSGDVEEPVCTWCS